MKHSRGVYRRRSFRRNHSRRHGSRSFFSHYSKILGIILAVLLLGGIYHWGFNTSQAENLSATTNAQSGNTEFSIGESNQWTFLQDSIDLIAGDKIKTLGNGKASLSVLGGNTLFLKENTEISLVELNKQSDQKKAVIRLERGDLWVHVGELGAKDSLKIITTEQSTEVSNGISAFSKNENDTQVLALKGDLKTTVFQNNKKTSTLDIAGGSTIEINELNKDSLTEEDTAQFVKEVPPSFVKSKWNLENLAKFFPSEAQALEQQLQKKPKPIEPVENKNIASPTISSPQNNAIIPAETTSVVIEGIAPENAYQISVNGYTLTKYQPGDRKWSYLASTKFGTMVPGKNTYTVKATTRDGQESAPAQISINYTAPKKVEKTKAPQKKEYPKPVITSPTGIQTNTPWETSSSIITLQGTVPKDTTKVLVNEFALRQYKPGSGKFFYIANAQYGNFVKGENLYVVKAIGPKNQSSEIAVTIIYKPVKL